MSESFSSEEDLDLQNLSTQELYAWWDLWLRQAQISNDLDEHLYSHGVFRVEPGFEVGPEGVRRVERIGEHEPPPRRG